MKEFSLKEPSHRLMIFSPECSVAYAWISEIRDYSQVEGVSLDKIFRRGVLVTTDGSIGQVIPKYIREQEPEDQRREQLKLKGL